MSAATEPPKPPRPLRLRVTAAAESILRSGHPWLFADSIREQTRAGESGDLAVIYDRKDRFLAIGLFDADSPLRVRILHAGKPAVLNRAWWEQRLRETLANRDGLFDAQTTGYRYIYGESDRWPGLVLDRFDTTLVLKLYTAAWFPRLPELLDIIRQTLQPSRVVLRLSRNTQAAAGRAGLQDGQTLFGDPPAGPVIFLENGLRFEADVVRGQKTGFFLDQRENRRQVETLARGCEVLNSFSFSGGFSLYAARGGAKTVADLDMSPHALESAQRNFTLNATNSAVAACAHETIQADTFRWLEQHRDRRFDLVILDPPSLARREAERAGAIAAYEKLALGGLAVLRPGGVLVAASCSAHVSTDEFFGMVRQAARRSSRPFTELATTGHPPDHPATFAEANYLKCIYLRLK